MPNASKQDADRRKHPRKQIAVDGHIACHTEDGEVTLRTHNVSCSGLYCHVARYLAPFTRVNVAMALPIRDGGRQAHNESFVIEGVVVRAEPVREAPPTGDYNVAIFFSGMTDEARTLLTQYVIEHNGEAVA